MKKKRWLPIKEILFAYLAVSKMLYWVETFQTMEYPGFGGVGELVLMRLLNRDLLLIISVILFYLLDMLIWKKGSGGNRILKHTVFYAIGFVGMVSLFYIYTWILNWFFVIEIPALGVVVSNMIGGYIVIAIALEIKYYFKAKEKETFQAGLPAPSADDKLAMLQVLLDDGVLTQTEFEHKKEKVLMNS